MKDSETQTLDQFVFGVLLLRCREDDLLLPPPHLPPSLPPCLWASPVAVGPAGIFSV